MSRLHTDHEQNFFAFSCQMRRLKICHSVRHRIGQSPWSSSRVATPLSRVSPERLQKSQTEHFQQRPFSTELGDANAPPSSTTVGVPLLVKR